MTTLAPRRGDVPSDAGPASRRTAADRVFGWFAAGIVPLAALAIFAWMFRPVSDPDTFWHLRLGDFLMRNWSFSGPEPWSALAEQPLVFHEWAPQLAYVAAFRVGGYPAVAWLQALVAVLLFVTLYACGRTFAPPLISALTAIAGFVGAVGSISARPQMASFILVAVFTTAWMWTSRDRHVRWWLVPLTWVWACSHGMWFLGPAIGTLVIVGMLLDRTIGPRDAARLALVPGLGVVAAAATPVGPRLLLTSGGMSDYTRYVGEWQPPSVLSPQPLVALGLAALVMIVWARTPGPVAWTELLLWGSGLALILMYARTVALGSIILSILAASVLVRHVTVSRNTVPSRRLEATVVILGTIAAVIVGPSLARADVSEPAGVPLAFDTVLEGLPPDTVVFNDYALGGWLLWAHPHLDPVIDGRADVYDIDYFNTTVRAYDVPEGWQETVLQSQATVAVLPTTSPLAAALRDQLNWTTVLTDGSYALLRQP